MIEVCNICKSEVKWLAPDSISYCPMCEVVVEDNTILVTPQEYEVIQNE